MKDVYKYELKERKKRYKNLNNTCRAKTGLGFRERYAVQKIFVIMK